MADPLSTTSTGTDSLLSPSQMQGIGSALQVFGTIKQGRDEAKAHKDLAQQYIQKGLFDARDFNRQQSAALSDARASRAASGVQINTGTALLVDEQSVFEIAQGVTRIQQAAAAAAWQQKKAAKKKKRGTLLSAGGAIVGGVFGGPAGAAAGAQIGASLG